MEIDQKLAEQLLNTYGSPLYIYDSDRLKQTIKHITQAIPYPHTRFHFASVTNGNISLLQIFKECGWGLHANTPGDIYLGLKAGFEPSTIVYSGSNLNRREMEQVLSWGVTTLNLDSLAQLNLCCQVYQSLQLSLPNSHIISPRLGLRLNYGDSRIGVTPSEFPEAIKITESVGLKLSGIHFYRGTGTKATIAFIQEIESLLAIGKLLPDWEYLDFGGGFGYAYHSKEIKFDWELFGEELNKSLQDTNLKLIIEPGRAGIASCGILLAKVVSVKWQGEKQIVGMDTTIANLAVLSVHGGHRQIVSYQKDTQQKYLTDVCGNTTYSRDYLGKNCHLPKLEIDDIIGILDVGAYGYAMSSHFLHRLRPAEVLLENGNHHLIRQPEDYKILLENQIFN